VRILLSPRVALLALSLLAGTGCRGTLTATGSVRFEGLMRGDDRPPVAAQLAPAVSWSSPSGVQEAQVGYTPVVVLEGGAAPRVRHRAHLETTSGRSSGVHPYARLSVDYGTIRPGDLVAGELLDVQGSPHFFTSYAYRGEAGWQGALRRRTHVRVALAADRSAGVGSDQAILPERSRLHLTARGAHQRTRAQGWEGGMSLSHYGAGGAALLLEGDLGASLRISPDLTVSALVGGAVVHASQGSDRGAVEMRPIARMAASWTPQTLRETDVRVLLMTRPEFDRADGGLHQRLQLQSALSVALARDARLATSLHWAIDVLGTGKGRSTLTADLALHLTLSSSWDGVVGVLTSPPGSQGGAEGTPAPQVRLYLGLSRRLALH